MDVFKGIIVTSRGNHMQNFRISFTDNSKLPIAGDPVPPKRATFYCTCCRKWLPAKYLQYTTKQEKVCNWCGETYMPAGIAAVIGRYK